MSNPAAKPLQPAAPAAAAVCALAGIVLFQWFGSSAQGYVKGPSLFWWWVSQWIDPGAETQHGWLILGISVWLFLRGLRGEGAAGALGRDGHIAGEKGAFWVSPVIAMLGGLALHALGFVAQQGRISIVALLLFAWGVLRLGGGRRWGAAAVFPLGFLVFAIPINVLDSVGFWLRLWVVDVSAWFAQASGIDVIQSGTQLVAPDRRYNYDVAAACSGVRSLAALAALSLLIGYLSFRSWWRRGLILLVCLPLVYLGNLARIVAIVFAAEAGGPRWGGVAHTVMGYAVFVIVLAGVLAAVSGLRRVSPEPAGRAPEGAIPSGLPGPTGANAARRRTFRYAAISGVVVVFAAGEMAWLHRWSAQPPRGDVGVVLAPDGRNPVELPAILGREWVGWPAAVTAAERDILPADTGYSRVNYVASRQDRQVFLSIVLSGRDRTSIHRPELCLVGQGWTLDGGDTHRFAYPGFPDAGFGARVLRVHRENAGANATSAVPQLVAYWFVGGDRIVATHWQRVALDMWNRLVRGRVDRWAYVLMQTDAADGEAAALARMQSVLNSTLPAFQRPLSSRG